MIGDRKRFVDRIIGPLNLGDFQEVLLASIIPVSVEHFFHSRWTLMRKAAAQMPSHWSVKNSRLPLRGAAD